MLSNYLTAKAGEVADEVATFRRSSLEAHRAYLAAGAVLAAVRDECKRGEWSPFLEAAGVEERTARNMMRLARAGVKPETVSVFGGVKAMLNWLQGATPYWEPNPVPHFTGGGYEAMKADIANHGLLHRITLCDGLILDGRARYRACAELGRIPLDVEWFDGDDPLSFILSKNLTRKSLTEDQRAMVGALMLLKSTVPDDAPEPRTAVL